VERIEFKEGWNPEIILHTICAFANDVNNWGGGYLIIGIAEENGRAVLPPKGIEIDDLDKMQQDLHKLCHKLRPAYFPVVEPYEIEGKHILVAWVPGGEHRPYKAPRALAKNAEMHYYIRRLSSTVKANDQEEQQLMQLAAKIPFDDRINHHASIDNLSLAQIRMFLQDVKSDLFESAGTMPFEELVRSMHIARGPSEYLRPVNAGLLFFNEAPEQFFPYSWIEINIYHDEIGDSFTEKVFKGPIHQQLRNALAYIRASIIEEHVEKIEGQAEAVRFYNYPYSAIEEALANAVYHKNYELREPIEVNVRLDQLEILSHAGPMPPLTKDDFKKERIVSRKYLNRRIGDFLRELHLTEGKGTGIPKIRKALKNNGSPEPIFETDDDRSYFLTIFKPRTFETFLVTDDGDFLVTDDGDKLVVSEKGTKLGLSEDQVRLLFACKEPRGIVELMQLAGRTNRTKFRDQVVNPLIEQGYLARTIPDKPTSSNQKYKITAYGEEMLK
jgi:ATP-dependent DNA helicase RecG